DLWKGVVDWVNSNFRDGKRVTDVGYFRDNTFSTDWFWTGKYLFVPVLGRTNKISLDTGAVNQERVQVSAIARGSSPDDQVTIVDAGGRQVGVVDFAAETLKAHWIPNILNQVFWLDGEKAALLFGRTHIAIYDRAKDELTAVHAPEAVIERCFCLPPAAS